MRTVLRELVAAVVHESWSHWMKWMFEQGTLNEDGTWTMPADKVNRWHRQMHTSYERLSEEEKLSDRNEARKYLSVFTTFLEKAVKEFWWEVGAPAPPFSVGQGDPQKTEHFGVRDTKSLKRRR